MSSRDRGAGNRKLARYFNGDEEETTPPRAEDVDVPDRRELVDATDDDDRPDYVRGDQEDAGDVGGGATCSVDGCDLPPEYDDPRAALGYDALPSDPLCHPHILDYA